MSRALALFFVGAMTVAACDLEFVAPAQFAAPPVLHVRIEVDARSEAVVRLFAQFVPGTGADGARRAVRSDTIVVLDTALTPSFQSDAGGLQYHAAWGRPALGIEPQVIAVTSPVVEDIDPIVARPVGSTIARAGPDTVVVERGANALLPLARPPRVDEIDSTDTAWFIRAAAGDRDFRLTGKDTPPDTVALSTRWLPAEFEGDLDVRLTWIRELDTELPGTGQVLTARTRTDLAWTVRVQSPDTTAASRGAP